MSSPAPPLAISDDQLVYLTNLLQPLPANDRSRFLEELASALRLEVPAGEPPGDGL
jgi:hypothetical protein